MKATDLLKKQHREVEKLFAQIEKARGARAKASLVDKLTRSLAGHMAIEQDVFYPACAEALRDEDMVREAYEEHGVAQFQCTRLASVRGDDPTLETRAKVLKELIQHHVEEEEEELFPKATKALGAAALEVLGEEMEERFEAAYAAGLAGADPRNADASMVDGARTKRAGAAKVAAKKATARKRA